MSSVDVLVVGAGPAGAAAAAGLARAGASVLVVDSARHPRPKPCAEYASPRILEELDRLGVPREQWADDAVALRGMRMHAGGRSALIEYADATGRRTAWGVDREHLDARLAAHAAESGAVLRERRALTALERRGGRVVGGWLRDLDTGREELVHAGWTIGADGVRSTVARLLGLDRPVRFPRRLGLVAHYEGESSLTDHGEMHVGRGGYVGLAPMSRGRLNVGMALDMRGARRPARDRFESAIDALPAVAERLSGMRRTSPIRGASPIGHRVSRAAGRGWLLVGDAAGFVDPFTGEGIYRALRSGRAAAEAIVAGDDVERDYLDARRRAFAAKSALTWLVQAFLVSPPLMRHAVTQLERRPAAALRLGSALGDLRPATDALTPRALIEVLAP